jgi:hypothetical protein
MMSQWCVIVGQHVFGPTTWFTPLKTNNIMVSRDVIIMFRSQIFPVKRLLFLITNGANEKYEVSRCALVDIYLLYMILLHR